MQNVIADVRFYKDALINTRFSTTRRHKPFRWQHAEGLAKGTEEGEEQELVEEAASNAVWKFSTAELLMSADELGIAVEGPEPGRGAHY